MKKWKELSEEKQIEEVLLSLNCLEIEKSQFGTIRSIILFNEDYELIKIKVDSIAIIEKEFTNE